ncbi:regulatory protein RecX [Longibacter sp.]|uniref:regulatory protein RecX n=1 Tax=Longibacter sp. TaxID=2045415 RepID=UPI003EB74ED8
MSENRGDRASQDIFEEAAAETAAREEGPDNGVEKAAASDETSVGPGGDPDATGSLPFEDAEPTGPETRRITDLRTQTKDENRVSVFVDGEFAFGCHRDVAAKHGLSEGQMLTPEEQQDVEVDEEIVRAKQRAFTYLAHKPRTETEVRRKLRRLDIGSRVIDEVVERLYELDYLDDEQYAQDYAYNRFSNKGYGPIRIERELIDRGIDRHLAERAVASLFEEENEIEAAREQARKRWPRVAGEQDIRKQKRKLFGYLQRRGFTPDVIYRVVDELVDP